MRAFVAIPAPEGWIAPLVRAQSRLPGGRPVPADDLHVTLAFLDEQPEDRLEALHETLEARTAAPAILRAMAFAVVTAGRGRLAVLDLAPDPGLTALRDGVRSAARGAGIDLPRDRFRPHVTLVRYPASAPADPRRLATAVAGLGVPDMAEAPARLLSLWSSRLTPAGPVYEALASYPTRAA